MRGDIPPKLSTFGTLQLKDGFALTWQNYIAVLRTLATHRVTYRFLGLLLSLWELINVVLWFKVLGMSSVSYLVAVLSDLADAMMSLWSRSTQVS